VLTNTPNYEQPTSLKYPSNDVGREKECGFYLRNEISFLTSEKMKEII